MCSMLNFPEIKIVNDMHATALSSLHCMLLIAVVTCQTPLPIPFREPCCFEDRSWTAALQLLAHFEDD